jgi:hypothetical protein
MAFYDKYFLRKESDVAGYVIAKMPDFYGSA